jgi:hypothetical protein
MNAESYSALDELRVLLRPLVLFMELHIKRLDEETEDVVIEFKSSFPLKELKTNIASNMNSSGMLMWQTLKYRKNVTSSL